MQELNRQSIDAISAIPLKNACELKEVIGKVTGEAFNPAVDTKNWRAGGPLNSLNW